MNASRTPLRDRIAARHGIPVERPVDPKPEPAEPWRPAWLRNLAAKDMTERGLS